MMVVQGFFFILGLVWLTGCMNHISEPTSYQKAIGLGIVEGTKGFQQLQEDLMAMNSAIKRVRGQVHQIEGQYC